MASLDLERTGRYNTNMRSIHLDPPPRPSQIADRYIRPPFSTVEQGIFQIEADGPEGRSTDRLREELEWLLSQRRSLLAMSARWLAELDRRALDGPAGSGGIMHRRTP